MRGFRFHFVLVIIILLAGASAQATYACKNMFLARSLYYPEIYLPYAESALDGREYRQSAIQPFKNHFYEAAIIHLPFANPHIFIKHSYASYKVIDRALNLLKKQELPLNHWAVQTKEMPGATTIAEIPDLPGQFIVGKMDGTLELVSMNFEDPRLARTKQNELVVWDGQAPHSYVRTQLEKNSEYVFTEREKRNALIFEASISGQMHNPAAVVRRNDFEIVKNPKAIISLFVTRDGVAWYRNISSEIHFVDLIDFFEAKNTK